jgi:hypothetical protein
MPCVGWGKGTGTSERNGTGRARGTSRGALGAAVWTRASRDVPRSMFQDEGGDEAEEVSRSPARGVASGVRAASPRGGETHRGQRGGHGARPVVAVEWAPRARERSPEGACLGAKSERRKASVERPRVDPRAFGARSRSAPRALRALRSGLYAGARPADVFSRVRRSSPRLSI